jgi:hypothetical protein
MSNQLAVSPGAIADLPQKRLRASSIWFLLLAPHFAAWLAALASPQENAGLS